MPPLTTPVITIRVAYADDGAALERLAALDSADAVPPRPLWLAEVDGELRAAMSVPTRGVIADPFVPTLELVALLARHVDAVAVRGPGWWRAVLRRRRARGGVLTAA